VNSRTREERLKLKCEHTGLIDLGFCKQNRLLYSQGCDIAHREGSASPNKQSSKNQERSDPAKKPYKKTATHASEAAVTEMLA
jgi:hypothetical protein